jgi:hypothetical protein
MKGHTEQRWQNSAKVRDRSWSVVSLGEGQGQNKADDREVMTATSNSVERAMSSKKRNQFDCSAELLLTGQAVSHVIKEPEAACVVATARSKTDVVQQWIAANPRFLVRFWFSGQE